MWTYETTLRIECNYTGAQPFWDYTLDTPEKGGHFATSPIFDPVYGFGGGGKRTAPSPVVTVPAAAQPKSMSSPTTVPAPKGDIPGPIAANSSVPGLPGMVVGCTSMSMNLACGSCVTDGPFAKYPVYLGPGNDTAKANTRCLNRNINAASAERGAASKAIARLMEKSTFEQFQTLDTSGGTFAPFNWSEFTPGVHSIGHMGVGGEVISRRYPLLAVAY